MKLSTLRFEWTLPALLALFLVGCSEDCSECPTCPGRCPAIVVRPDGSGDYTTIQAAIDASDSLDVIELTDGIFAGDGNRDIDFKGKAVNVRSAGGNAQTCIIDCGGSESEPHNGFLFITGESRLSRLEGLTVRGGYAASGGGIVCDGSFPSIIDCRITGNTAAFLGGGIALGDASPFIASCVIDSNTAMGGGGLYYQYGSPQVVDCEFAANTASQTGGGLGGEHGYPVVAGCTFTANSSGSAGGGIRCFYGSADLVNLTVIGNTAAEVGGGLSLEDVERTTVVGCRITGNLAAAGGGAHSAGGTTFHLCTVDGNTGSLYGGGLALTGPSMSVSACTIVGNSTPALGGGILASGEHELAVEGSIIAFNDGGEALHLAGSATAAVSCSDFYGNEGGNWIGSLSAAFGIDGNISQDPLFCDVDAGDFSLELTSPCRTDSCGVMGAWPADCAR